MTENEERGLIEVPGERDEPKFDFGEGELAAKVKMLKEKLGLSTGEPDSGDGGAATPEESGQPVAGDGIDWSQFDLDPNVAHLYPAAQVIDTPQGPKWATLIAELMTREKNVNPSAGGRKVNAIGENVYMGDFVNEVLRSAPEQGCTPWKLVAFLPGSMTGMIQVIFERKVQVALPDPRMTEKAVEAQVEAPKDEELTKIEEAAAAWAGEPAPETPYVSTDGAVEGA